MLAPAGGYHLRWPVLTLCFWYFGGDIRSAVCISTGEVGTSVVELFCISDVSLRCCVECDQNAHKACVENVRDTCSGKRSAPGLHPKESKRRPHPPLIKPSNRSVTSVSSGMWPSLIAIVWNYFPLSLQVVIRMYVVLFLLTFAVVRWWQVIFVALVSVGVLNVRNELPGSVLKICSSAIVALKTKLRTACFFFIKLCQTESAVFDGLHLN